MFFGWGQKSKQAAMPDGKGIVLTWRYFSLMFLFQIAFGKKWFLLTNDRAEDRQVPKGELQAMYGEAVPDLNPWQQWGLLIAIAVIALFAILTNALGG